jgi:tetratricopeptide (TPR) repeat protein
MENAYDTAVQHHQAGRLAEAVSLYRHILAGEPQNVDALHLLGVAAYQQGNARQAVDLIGRALALRPDVAAFHCNLAEVYRALGQLDQAAASCRTALRLEPGYAEAANNLGLVLQAQGRLQEAADQFRQAIQLKPALAMAHNNLGNAVRLLGDKAQAIVHFRQALNINPHLTEAHSNLGQLFLEMGELPEALHHCREAVRLRPHFPEAHNNLGNVLREQGQLAEASACYEQALRLNPNLAMTYNNVGQALQEEGQFDQAASWYQEALRREPNSARIHCNLASLLEEQENYEAAKARYEIALRLDPGYAEAHNGLGYLYHEQGLFDQADAKYREALRLKPDFAPGYCNLGTVLEELGAIDEAVDCLRQALAHDPRYAGAYAQLATILRRRLPAADLAAMQSLLAWPYLSEGKQAPLHYGLAQVFDAQEEYQAAARHLEQANRLRLAGFRKRGQGYDPTEHSRFVDELMTVFKPEFFARVREFGSKSDRPVFIVGLPRSGSTLTEQILASHSQVYGAGELRFARDAFESLPRTMNATRKPAECVRDLDRTVVEHLAAWHLEQMRQRDPDAPRFVDKMPDNYLYLGLIAALFPQSKIIHSRRDLRDIAISCWMTNFRHIRWACDPQHIAERFRDYRRLMGHWRRVLPVPMLEIDYEETVADLEGVARRLVAWCGLEWEPACLAFHETKRPVRTASVTQVREPIYTRSLARWKHYAEDLKPLLNLVSQ